MMYFLGAILGLLPGFAWLLFYLQEDLHPEPKKLIGITFIMGMASAFFALAFEIAANFALSKIGIVYLSTVSLFILALVEETVKFGAAYLAVRNSAYFDEPVDAMIYIVVAALGFATVENIGVLTSGGGSELALISGAFAATSLRFVGATLLHSLSSSIVGYYWALGIRNMKAWANVSLGLVFASILHGIFNYFIINHGSIIYVAVFLLVVGFFVLNDFEELRHKKL